LLRLTVGFSLTVVLVVAAMWLLRRYGNRFMRATTGFAVRTLGRATVAPGLRVTVVDVEGLRFLIAESRQHLQVVPLAVRGEVDAASRSQS
jgi:flagellar biogenesis protein FliO